MERFARAQQPAPQEPAASAPRRDAAPAIGLDLAGIDRTVAPAGLLLVAPGTYSDLIALAIAGPIIAHAYLIRR